MELKLNYMTRCPQKSKNEKHVKDGGHTFSDNVNHSGQVLVYILFTGDLQVLVSAQGHQLEQRGHTLHPAQQHHHMSCRTQHAGQEEAPPLAKPLQHALGEDEEFAVVPVQPGEVVPSAGHGGDVVAADPGLWDGTSED